MFPAVGLVAGGFAAVSGWLTARFRPAARARRGARKALRRVERESRALDRLTGTAVRGLKRSAAAYARQAAEERLRTLPLEDLRGFGAEKVRWGALREAGLNSAADIKGLSKAQLERLEGVGPVSAERVHAARVRLLAANREEPVSPPAVGSEGGAALGALATANRLMAVRTELGGLPLKVKHQREDLRERYDGVRRGTRLWRELFGGKQGRAERDAAVLEAAAIQREVAELAGPDGLLKRSRTARKTARKLLKQRPTKADLARDHAARFAEYCSVIERALPGVRITRGGNLGGLTDEIVERVERFTLQTSGLLLTLRTYQEFGAKFMLTQERTLLGDEMGLGKTIEALAVFAHLSEVNAGERFLVVCPASVLHNWMREVKKCTSLDALLIHGSERDDNLKRWIDEGGVAVTSFGTLKALPMPPETVAKLVDALVVDEAHYVKNPEAERTKAIEGITELVRYVVFMTGTPLENRLDEFRQLVSYLQPDVSQELGGSVSSNGELVLGRQKFQQAVAPVYLRRNQDDVLKELPERIDIEEWVQLNAAEQAAYREAVLDRNIMAMRRAATLGGGLHDSSKLGRLEELLTEYGAGGRKVLVFSYFLDVLQAVEKRFAESVVGKITGAVSPGDRQALCDQLEARDGHAILLSQIQAGGVGMNIQSASVVVLLEPQWKPSTEEQAVARAHRMGQTRTVCVHRFYAGDSVDERMKEVLAEKQELFDTFARGSAIKDASREATASLTKQVIDTEVRRIGAAMDGECADDGRGNEERAGA